MPYSNCGVSARPLMTSSFVRGGDSFFFFGFFSFCFLPSWMAKNRWL